jgi:hypothetical protein
MKDNLNKKSLDKKKVVLALTIMIFGIINIYAVLLSGSLNLIILVPGIILLAFGVRLMYLSLSKKSGYVKGGGLEIPPEKKRISYALFIVQMIFLIGMTVLTFVAINTEKAVKPMGIVMNIMGLFIILSASLEKYIFKPKE